MRKKLLFSTILVLYLIVIFSNLTFALAQTPEATGEPQITEEENLKPANIEEFSAYVKYDESVEINGEVSFEFTPEKPEILPQGYTITWKFSDGKELKGDKVSHIFKNPGVNDIHVILGSEAGIWTDSLEVFVYEKLILFITDRNSERQKILSLSNFAKNQGIYLQTIESFERASGYLSEEVLSQKLIEASEDLKKTDQIVIWSNSEVGLTLLNRVHRTLEDTETNFNNKNIIFVTDRSFTDLKNIAKGTFNTIKPARLIMTRYEALWTLFESAGIETFLKNIQLMDIKFLIIDSSEDEEPKGTFMANMVNFMIDKGVPSNTIRLILILPVIVTFVAFVKQIIGISTLGVYTPSILALSFIALDLTYGLSILIILLFIGTLGRYLLKRYRLLYIPRMSILLTFVNIGIFFLLFLASYFNAAQLLSLSIFPILIMGTLVEKFVSIQTDRGIKEAMLLIVETILVSLGAYYVAEWEFLQSKIIAYPEIIFIFIFINIILGRWTGLRLFEYVRFRELIGHAEEE